MALSLDGNTSFIGTEFIKLLNTGSSDLATVEYVDEQVALGGGGGDLSNYYTQTEVDTLLNNKLNVNNPQDIIGNLRLDSTNGNSKLIINAVSAPQTSDDFYCNGNGQFNGTLRVSILTSTGDVNAQGVTADTFNSNVIANDIIFKHNDIEYMRFNVDDNVIDLSTDLDLQTSELLCNNFRGSDLNDVVFNISDEFLRLQLSDNTVRVPNTKAFLSQNIFTDIVKPLAFTNDISLQGKNTTSDGYEEYFQINSTNATVDFNKEIDVSENVVMQPNKFLYFDETSKVRYIRSSARSSPSVQNHLDIINEDGSQGRIRLLIGSNGSNTTDEQFLVDNTIISCKRNLRAGVGLETNTIDTIGSANLSFQRGGTEYLRFDTTDDNITCSKEIVAGNSIVVDIAKKLTMKPSLEGGVNIFDIRNLHPVVDNPMIRYRVGEGGGETIVCEMTNNAVSLQRNVIVGTAYELRTNAIDTTTDNDLVISRNNIPFLTLDKFTEDTVEKEAIICSKQLRANSNILVKNLQINQFASRVEYADFRLHNADSVVRFFVGNSTNPNFQITNANINLNRETIIGSVKTNTINSNGDNDLVFQRNGTEIFKCETSAGIDNNDIINVTPSGGGMSAVNVYGNSFKNRTLTSDTVFYGANSAGDNRVEYMKWNRTDQSLDFNAPIDNTNIAVIGNIVDTTVSDERLNTNIQDVESNYCNCIKNVKIKTFEYKDEKYKDSDEYGMIAQDLRAHLPKEFKNIVKETKPKKDEGEAYLSINYMKLSLILWGCCQEQQSKIEHLESRLFELEDVVKESKGKGKDETKPKAKAKSKSKAKNVD